MHIGVAAEVPDVGELLPALVSALVSREDLSKLLELLEPLVERVLTDEFSSSRHPWLRVLLEGCERAGVDWPLLKKLVELSVEVSHSTPMSVKLKDGTSILDFEFEATIVDFESMRTAIERAETQSYVQWDRVATSIIASASRDQLSILSQLLGELGSRQHLVAALIIKRYRELGEADLAETLGNRFLLTSPSHGWIEYFDGGTRLHIARALVEINPARRVELFRLLADDYVGGLRNPRDLVMGLNDLLPIIFSEVPWGALWREISEHVAHLSEFRESEAMDVTSESTLSCSEMLVKMSLRDYQLPVPEMQTRFVRLLTHWLIEKETRALVLQSIESELGCGLLEWQAILPLYMARDTLKEHSEQVVRLLDRFANSRDVSVRINARSIQFGSVTAEQLMVRSPAEDLPVVLRLALTGGSSGTSLYGVPEDFVAGVMTKPRVPAEFFRIWMPELKLIARASNIPLENLLQRAQQIADEILRHSKWGIDAENFIRTYLSGIELKITYRRPWAHAGEVAFLCLVSELIDFGLLEPGFALAANLGRFFDERLLRSVAVQRPVAWVGDLTDRMTSSGVEKWVESARTDQNPCAFYQALPEGFVVLAEHTKFVRHEWEMPEEQRTAVLRFPGTPSPAVLDRLDALMPGFKHDPAGSYPDGLSAPIDERAPVVGEHQFTLRVGPQRWFAINPAFARRCGLTAVPRDDFAWVNRHGEVVARTIHWRDGPGRRQPPKFDEVFGEGWLVTMRRDELCRAFNPATFQLDCYVTRKASVRDESKGNVSAQMRSTEIVALSP
jgi:hypothetical protein